MTTKTIFATILGSMAVATAAALGAISQREETRMSSTTSDAELRARLTPEQYEVVRRNGTEPPFRNAYWNHHEPGIYVDIVSGEPLFASTNKFNSGTGWPSFDRPIRPDAVVEKTDRSLGMARTEVRSRRADSHLGHLFDDGPEPTGHRYCINSASLRFVPIDRLRAEGLGEFLPLFGRRAPRGAERAAFAAGCFWGVEGYFRRVPGVISTEVGYAGGRTEDPTYRQVVTGATGHAEAIRVEFDPEVVSYETLVKHFLRLHDPTALNRQGNDVGTQYRSAIFFQSAEQETVARRVLRDAARNYDRPIVTEVARGGTFTPAEEYHQDYLEKNPGGYCHVDLGRATEPLE